MTNLRKMGIGTLTLSATLLLGACSGEADDDFDIDMDRQTEIPAETELDDVEESEADAESKKGIENLVLGINLTEAVDLFYQTFNSKDINIDSIEFEQDNGRYIYEIEGWDGQYEYELEIDAESAEVIEQEKKEDSDEGDTLELDSIISPAEAMQAALKASGSGEVDEWELEFDNGRMIYEIDISDGEDQEIDALTGDVL